MAIAVDADAIGLAVPGADRRPQVVDVIVGVVDLGFDPVGHLGSQAFAADVAFEGRAHLDDVEIDSAGGDRLMEARIVVGLGQVDPGNLSPGIGLPGLQEAAEQEIVQILVVEAHEAQLDALELAGLDAGLGGAEAELADLLPIGVGGGALAGARNLHDLLAQRHLLGRHVRGGSDARKSHGIDRAHRRYGRSTLQDLAAALGGQQVAVDVDSHGDSSFFSKRIGRYLARQSSIVRRHDALFENEAAVKAAFPALDDTVGFLGELVKGEALDPAHRP